MGVVSSEFLDPIVDSGSSHVGEGDIDLVSIGACVTAAFLNPGDHFAAPFWKLMAAATVPTLSG